MLHLPFMLVAAVIGLDAGIITVIFLVPLSLCHQNSGPSQSSAMSLTKAEANSG